MNLNQNLEELLAEDELSVRAFNVCKALGLKTVSEFIGYYDVHQSFMMAPNCGDKTDQEFKKLYDYLKKTNNISHNTAPTQGNLLDFNQVIISKFLQLTVRSRNRLLEFLNLQNPDPEALKEIILSPRFRPKSIRNIGVKSEAEIRLFIASTLSFWESLQKVQPDKDYFSRLISRIVGYNFTEQRFIEQGKAKELFLLSVGKTIIETKFKENPVDLFIFKSHFGFLEKTYSLGAIAQKFNLTRERIRQKKVTVLEKVLFELRQLKTLIPYTNYKNLLTGGSIVILSDSLQTNEVQEVGEHFATFAFGSIFEEDYYTLTKDDKIPKPRVVDIYENYTKFKTIQGYYLVSKKLARKQELIGLFTYLLEKVSQRCSQDILLDISSFFSRDFSPQDLKLLCGLFTFESGVAANPERGVLKLPKNSIKLIHEYARDVLASIGRPAHVNEILELIRAQYPDFKSNASSLRNLITRNKELFIYFGRTSTFGLKEWELSGSIKGGTIRDIVEEYLKKFDFLCHISSVLRYVNNYRSTSYNSLMTNLKLMTDNRFTFYKNGYIGLSAKDYTKKDSSIPVLEDQEISLDDLLNAIFS